MALLTGLSSYWPLTEASGTRADIVGPCTLTDNNTVASGSGKFSDLAADFETDASEYLSRSDEAALSFGSDEAFTFSVWVNPESITNRSIILSKGIGTGKDTEVAIGLHTSGQAFVRIGNGSAFIELTSSTTVTLGQWSLIIAWHDPASDVVGISINDVSTTAAWPNGTVNGAGRFLIGSSDWEENRFPSFALKNLDSGSNAYGLFTAYISGGAVSVDPVQGTAPDQFDAIYIANTDQPGTYVRVTVRGPDDSPVAEWTTASGLPTFGSVVVKSQGSGYVTWTFTGSTANPEPQYVS